MFLVVGSTMVPKLKYKYLQRVISMQKHMFASGSFGLEGIVFCARV